jgi:hypothetical protein
MHLHVLAVAILAFALLGCTTNAATTQVGAIPTKSADDANAILQRTTITMRPHTTIKDLAAQMQAATGLDWVVNWGALAALDIRPESEIPFVLTKPTAIPTVLDVLGRQHGLYLGAFTQGEIVILTTLDGTIAHRALASCTKVYNITDLARAGFSFTNNTEMNAIRHGASGQAVADPTQVVEPPNSMTADRAASAAQAVIHMIVAHITPTLWIENGGQYGRLDVVQTDHEVALLVDTVPETHEKIRVFLAELRRGLKLKAQP